MGRATAGDWGDGERKRRRKKNKRKEEKKGRKENRKNELSFFKKFGFIIYIDYIIIE
jgi:hypothetical protein